MKDLIEALGIFLKYGNPHNPTHCEHDVFMVAIPPSEVSDQDLKRLEALGFDKSIESGDACFISYRFGSA